MKNKVLLVTGGAGFIGSAVVRRLLDEPGLSVVNVDKLTYAGNLESLPETQKHSHYRFEKVDICDAEQIRRLFREYRPYAVMHLAAESHVDRSIDSAAPFIETNFTGTFVLLEEALRYWSGLEATAKAAFRFHHVSTDEVYGTLGAAGRFTEQTPYQPNSPYAASKASSDHLVRAWHHTYGLPILISNCSNNYGPYQFPEKLIPLLIINAKAGKPLPIYGDGKHVRDWLYVDDHVRALMAILEKGAAGETYNIGGNSEKTNMEVVQIVCAVLDEMLPDSAYRPHNQLISHVADRPGHDLRYAMDTSKLATELGWEPVETFASGIRKTVAWYLDHTEWWQRILDGRYRANRLDQKES